MRRRHLRQWMRSNAARRASFRVPPSGACVGPLVLACMEWSQEGKGMLPRLVPTMFLMMTS